MTRPREPQGLGGPRAPATFEDYEAEAGAEGEGEADEGLPSPDDLLAGEDFSAPPRRFNRWDEPAPSPRRSMAEDLPRPLEVTGTTHRSSFEGNTGRTVPGRPVRPPMLAAASLNPGVTTFRVLKLERGVPVSIGRIEATASEEDFVRRFAADMPAPGQDYVSFELRCLDGTGREVGTVFHQHFGPNHATLADLRAQEAAASSGAGNTPPAWAASIARPAADNPIPDKMLGLVERVLVEDRATTLARQDEERRRQEAAMQQQLQLTQTASMGLTDAYNKMIEGDQNRQAALMDRTVAYLQQGHQQATGFLNTVLAEQAARAQSERQRYAEEMATAERKHQMELERLRFVAEQDRIAAAQRAAEERAVREAAEAARERQRADEQRRWEMRVQEERARIEDERKAREAEATRRERERDEDFRRKEAALAREHEMALKRMEIEAKERADRDQRKAEQEREHQARLRELELAKLQVVEQRTANLGLDSALGPITKLLGVIGIDPKDAAQRALGLSGDDEGPSQTLEVVKALAPVVGGALQTGLQAWMMAKTGAPNRATRRGRPGRGTRRLPAVAEYDNGGEYYDEDYAEDDEDDEDDEPRQPARRFIPAQTVVPAPVPQPRAGVPVPVAGQAVAGQAVAPVTQPAAAPSAAAQPAQPAQPALTVQEAAEARAGAADLVEALAEAADEAWEALVIGALTTNPLIYTLIQQQGLRLTVLNAGGDVALFTRLAEMLRAHPLIPDDLNYGA